jgi:hypothetical protein
MNFRLEGTVDKIMEMMNQNQYLELRAMCQLIHEIDKHVIFEGYVKGNIYQFTPTYKVIIDSDTFKTKHRAPAWTDRIFYRCNEPDQLILTNYDSNNLVKQSDHRPLFAQFLLKIKTDVPV